MIHVVANVSTPEILTPTQVSIMQEQLSQDIKMPVELIVHCTLSGNVSAVGSLKNALEQDLDGTFVKSAGSDIIKDIATTEQVIREYLSTDVALDLSRVEYVPRNRQRNIMLAHVSGFRRIAAREIRQLEASVRKATENPSIELVFSHLEKTISTVDGTVQYGWIPGKQYSPETIQRARQIHAYVVSFFDGEKVYKLVNTNVTRFDDTFYFMLEIVGPDVCPRRKIETLQAQLLKKFAEPINLYALSRAEIVHGPEGLLSLKELNQYFSERQKENLPDDIPLILEASRH